MNELPKAYEPTQVEQKWYRFWLEQRYFHADAHTPKAPFSIAIQLMIYDGFGDWRYINTYAEEVDRVTAADLQRAAKQYLTKENRTVGIFLRKTGDAAAAADDPEIAALPAPAQGMARQQIARIQAETDPAKLREGLAQMEQAKAQVPPEMKPVFELILKRAQERLAALEGQKK